MRHVARVCSLLLGLVSLARADVRFPQTGDTLSDSPAMSLSSSLQIYALGKMRPEAEVIALGEKEEASYFKAGARQVNQRGEIKRVVYPMSGSDVAAAFRAFSHGKTMPEELLLIDKQIIGRPKQIAEVYQSPRAKRSAFNYLANRWQSGASGGPAAVSNRSLKLYRPGVLGAELLWKLETLGAQSIEVTYLATDGRTLTKLSKRSAPKAALITFSLDGRQHRVTYVQHDLTLPKLPKLVRSFLAGGVDALFMKGTGTFDTVKNAKLPPSGYRTFASLPHVVFGKQAIGALNPRHGLMLTDFWRWGLVADLGLLPLKRRKAYPVDIGYTLDHHNPKIGAPPVLKLSSEQPKQRLQRGLRYVVELVKTFSTAKTADAQLVALYTLKRIVDRYDVDHRYPSHLAQLLGEAATHGAKIPALLRRPDRLATRISKVKLQTNTAAVRWDTADVIEGFQTHAGRR